MRHSLIACTQKGVPCHAVSLKSVRFLDDVLENVVGHVRRIEHPSPYRMHMIYDACRTSSGMSSLLVCHP